MPHHQNHHPRASALAALPGLLMAPLIGTFIVATSAWAQTGCSALADPNSTVGQNCRTPITFNRPQQPEPPSLATPPFAPPAPGATGLPRPLAGGRQVPEGQQPGRGQFVCAVVEPGTGRCLTMRPNTRDYDSAVQTGVEAAMMGMQVQADAIRRAQEMGLVPPGMAQPGMAPVGMPQWPQQAGHVGPAQADCVSASVARFRSVTGRYPTPAEEQPILLQCQ